MCWPSRTTRGRCALSRCPNRGKRHDAFDLERRRKRPRTTRSRKATHFDDIIWPFESSRFAKEYLAELRRLGTEPLVDVGVVDRPIEIDVDTELSWITERDRIGTGDIVNIVTTPDRLYISDSDGSNRTQVLAFSSTGRHGATIDIRVPHFTAFARVKYELESLLRRRALPNEGPDIVYERLCSFATQFFPNNGPGRHK